MTIKSNPCKEMTTHQYVKSIEAALIADYVSGLTTKDLASKYKISCATAWKRVKNAGVMRSISEQKIGNKNTMWRGDAVKYRQLHVWVRSRKEGNGLCDICNTESKLDLANISDNINTDTYNRNLNNWQWLCRSCHMHKDGRTKRLRRNND